MQNKTNQVHVRMSDLELERLHKLAAAESLNPQSYIRQTIKHAHDRLIAEQRA